MYINKVQILGNITRDPELKALPSGVSVTSFSVATNRVWKDKDGQKKEEAEFHNITLFGNTAENVSRYMKKGSQIYIEGRLQTRSWEDKETGKKIYRTEIIGENVQFGNNKDTDSRSTGSARKESPRKIEAEQQWEEVSDDINPDDIPF